MADRVSGVAADRLPAVETARTRRWGAGTVLRSDAWDCSIEIVEVQEKFLKIRRLGQGGRGTSIGNLDRIRSLPGSVEPVKIVR